MIAASFVWICSQTTTIHFLEYVKTTSVNSKSMKIEPFRISSHPQVTISMSEPQLLSAYNEHSLFHYQQRTPPHPNSSSRWHTARNLQHTCVAIRSSPQSSSSQSSSDDEISKFASSIGQENKSKAFSKFPSLGEMCVWCVGQHFWRLPCGWLCTKSNWNRLLQSFNTSSEFSLLYHVCIPQNIIVVLGNP